MNVVVHHHVAFAVWRQSLLEGKTGKGGEIERLDNCAFLRINRSRESDSNTGNEQPAAGFFQECLNRVFDGTFEIVSLFRGLDFDAVNDAEAVVKHVEARLGTADVDADPSELHSSMLIV